MRRRRVVFPSGGCGAAALRLLNQSLVCFALRRAVGGALGGAGLASCGAVPCACCDGLYSIRPRYHPGVKVYVPESLELVPALPAMERKAQSGALRRPGAPMGGNGRTCGLRRLRACRGLYALNNDPPSVIGKPKLKNDQSHPLTPQAASFCQTV